MLFYRVQAFCDLLDSRKEPFGFPIDPFSSALSLRGPLVHPRPNLSDSRVDLFERIAQRGQRLEQVVPVKAPEVGGAGVPAILKEGQPGPHPGTPLCPAGNVAGSGLNIPDVPCKDMKPGIQISLRACGEPTFLRVVRTSVDPAVDLFDLLSEVAKQGQRFRLQERNRHGDHGQGQNTAGVLDGLVRVRYYGVDGSSHDWFSYNKVPCV